MTEEQQTRAHALSEALRWCMPKYGLMVTNDGKPASQDDVVACAACFYEFLSGKDGK